MVDKGGIIKGFITNFILKERRERSYLELTTPKRRAAFIGRFNHEWDKVINMAYLEKLHKHIDYPSKIQEMLGFKDSDLCYVISHYDDFDDQILPFKDVFSYTYSRGLATLIINMSGTKFYMETEQVQGPPDRFIGKRIKE